MFKQKITHAHNHTHTHTHTHTHKPKRSHMANVDMQTKNDVSKLHYYDNI